MPVGMMERKGITEIPGNPKLQNWNKLRRLSSVSKYRSKILNSPLRGTQLQPPIKLRMDNGILSLANRHFSNLGDGNMITEDELEVFINELLEMRQ